MLTVNKKAIGKEALPVAAVCKEALPNAACKQNLEEEFRRRV